MRKTVILGIVIFSCFTAVHASDKLDLARELQKLSSNLNDNTELLNDLTGQKNIAEKLHDLFFADTATMLKRLGDDNFTIRETATLMLSMRTPEESENIKEYMKQSHDPEVQVRCRQILKNKGKNKHKIPKLMTYAFQIIFASPEKSPDNIDFLRFYFRNFSMLDSKAQSLLLPAFKKSRSYQDKLVNDIIAAYKNGVQSGDKEMWEDGLKTISEEFYLSIVKRVSIEKQAEHIIAAIEKKGSSSSADYGRVEKKLLKMPGFDLIKENFIKQCFKSGTPFRVILGVRMMRHNPEMFIEDMINAVIYAVKKRYSLSMIDTQLVMINNRKRVFRKYTPLFLNSISDELLEFGLYLIDDPDKYKTILVKRMLADPNPVCLKFLKYHYPEDVPEFQKMVVAEIKGITQWQSAVSHFSKALKILEYNGHDLDDYFEAHSLSVADGINMHVSPIIIAKNALPRARSSCWNHELEYLLDNVAPKDRDVVLRAIEQHLEKFSSYMFVYPLLKRAPELINAVLDQIEKIGENDSYARSSLIKEQLFQIGELLENEPKIEKKFTELTESDNDYVRLFSNTVLLSYKKENDRYADAIIELFRGRTSEDYSTTVLTVFLKSASPEKVKEFMPLVLEKYPKSINDKTEKLFTSEHKSSLPALIHYLKNHNGGLKEKMDIIKAAFNIDKSNQELLAYTQKQYNEAKVDISDTHSLLEHLTSLKVEIDLPESLYSDWKGLGWKGLNWNKREFLFAAINNSDKNVPGVSKFLSKYLAKDHIRTSGFLYAMEDYKKVADVLLPIFMEVLVKKQNIKNAANIFKSFPGYMKTHIPEIEKVYSSLEDPKNIDDMGYMIAALRQDGSSLVPAVEEHYKNESDDSQKLCYYFVMASIHPDKSVREENATKLLALMNMFNDKNDYIINRFIMTSGYIALEFPGILNPFLLQCAKEATWYRQDSAIAALTVKQPYTPTAMSLITEILQKKLSGIADYTHYYQIMYCLDELKVIPKSLHPLLKEIAKDNPDDMTIKVIAKLK